MPSTFFGLMIAGSGLRAANANLNTTAHNVSNLETKGYSRQEVTQTAQDAIRVFQTFGCAGAGVEAITVERVRNTFYDEKYRNNESRFGEFEMKAYYTNQIQEYFVDDDSVGFKALYNGIMNQIQEVIKNAGDGSTKKTCVNSFQAMVDYFNDMSENLREVQNDANQEIKLQIDMINSYAQELATLNKQINTVAVSGANPNNLKDKRDLILDDLSKLMNIQVIETPIMNRDDPTRETGATRMIVKCAGGFTLVDNDYYNSLNYVPRQADEKMNQSDIDGLYDVYWADGTEFPLNNKSLGGLLQGLAQVRDGNNSEHFYGRTISVRADLDKGVHIVEVLAGDERLKDLDKCTLSNTGGLIHIGAGKYKYQDWSFDEDRGVFTFTIEDNGTDSKISLLKANQYTEVGTSINYQGVPYYNQQMNEWIRTFSKAVNQLLMTGYTSDGREGQMLLTGDKPTDKTQFTIEELLKTDPGDTSGKGYYYLTAANFAVSKALLEDASLFATKKVPGDGQEETFLMDDLKVLMSDERELSYRGSSTSEFLEIIMADISLSAQNANTFADSYANLQNTLGNQRISTSGVDSDEEGVNLIKFQNAYNMSAKMVQTFQEIYDKLIQQTGV